MRARLALMLVIGATAACDEPDGVHGAGTCDSAWRDDGVTHCELACESSTRAMDASGPACAAETVDDVDVACDTTFEFGGLRGCCSRDGTDVRFAECSVDAWQARAELPGPRLESAVTALGQRVVVLGGFDQNVQQGLRITDEVIAYDPERDEWSDLPRAPVAWTHGNFTAGPRTLYLLGGAEGLEFLPRGESWAIDLDDDQPMWRTLAPQPVGMERSASGVITALPYIILVGGATATEAVSTIIQYDIVMDEWTEVTPPLPAPRSHPAVMEMPDGSLIVAGGLAGLDATTAVDTTWILRPGATAWEELAPLPVARGGCAYGVVFDDLVCAGGEAGGAALSDVHAYDWRIDEWTALPNLPERRAGTQGAAVGGRLFVPGGAGELVFDPTTSMFELSYLATIDR